MIKGFNSENTDKTVERCKTRQNVYNFIDIFYFRYAVLCITRYAMLIQMTLGGRMYQLKAMTHPV